jgi:23S rRNA (pseudouridine1915-N3)-methyltransferase
MQVSVFAIGKMKSGPEQELVTRYFDRFAKSAPALGFSFSGVIEKAESRHTDALGRKREEADWLSAYLDSLPNAKLIVLDEIGKAKTSVDFSNTIARFRDDGVRSLVFAIGGADGHDAQTKERADLVLSFGPATWPHQLARIMLAEQLYRSATILSGHPYHRV